MIRRDANQPPQRIIRLPTFWTVMDQFAIYPHVKYGRILVEGYIRKRMKQSSLKSTHYVSIISDLCTAYYYDDRDGYDQLAYQIFVVLDECNRRYLSEKIVKIILRRYFKMTKSRVSKAAVRFYFEELIRLKYIIPVDGKKKCDANGYYTVAVTKRVIFRR